MNPRKPRRNCLFCKKEVNEVTSIYCSIKCQHDHKWELSKLEIEKYEKFPSSPRVAKRYLSEKRGRLCEICKNVSWEGNPIPLVLDHINGNSDNWDISNCRLICPNCDTFTPFYKGRNKGNGRFLRRQRYLAGLSY
jgi:hypothetical protein